MPKFIAVIAAVAMLAIGSAAYAGGKQNNQGQNCNSQGGTTQNSQGQDQK